MSRSTERADRSASEDRTDGSRTDDRADKVLPITAEVGDEGGSYADPTNQADTFAGPAGNDRVDPKRVDAPAVGTQSEAVTAGTRRDTPDDEVKHASEPPDTSR